MAVLNDLILVVTSIGWRIAVVAFLYTQSPRYAVIIGGLYTMNYLATYLWQRAQLKAQEQQISVFVNNLKKQVKEEDNW